MSVHDSPKPIAVAIPCFNEAAAIATVIAAWREALPEAEIHVFDNNSTDGTGARARSLGVNVVPVPEQGKGHAVQAIFRALGDRPAVVLVDGDGTYPASEVGRLLAPIRDGSAAMSVGARRPVAEVGAMTPLRGLGNHLIRGAFRVLIGPGAGDLLSGYRVFGPRYLQEITLRSSGFEIETEMTAEAVARGWPIANQPVPYYPRIAGSTSKLRAFRDGRRIMLAILRLSLRLRPWRLGLILAASIAVGSAILIILLR